MERCLNVGECGFEVTDRGLNPSQIVAGLGFGEPMLRTLSQGNGGFEVGQGLSAPTLCVQQVRQAVERVDLAEGIAHRLCECPRFSIVAKRLLQLSERSERLPDLPERPRFESSVSYRSRDRERPQIAIEGLAVSPEHRQASAQIQEVPRLTIAQLDGSE
jgi:hypothetical protein